MAVVRTFSDLDRIATEAQARHERFREARREEVTRAIEVALDAGAADLASVMARLGQGEREDLVDVFPQLLSRLSRADSADEMRAVIAGGRALLRSVAPTGGLRDPTIQRLSRVALATATVEPEQRRALTDRLREIDEAPGPRRLSVLWFGYRLRALAAAVGRIFALKP